MLVSMTDPLTLNKLIFRARLGFYAYQQNQSEPAVHSSSLQVTRSLWRPLHLRVWCRVIDSAHTLKDIGAPEWAVLDAAERCERARPRLGQFSTWRGV